MRGMGRPQSWADAERARFGMADRNDRRYRRAHASLISQGDMNTE